MRSAEEFFPEEYKTIAMFSTLYALRCRTDDKERKEIFRCDLFLVQLFISFSEITNEADSNWKYIEGIHVDITRQLMDQFPIESESLSTLSKTIQNKVNASWYDLCTVIFCLAYIWPNHVILHSQTMQLDELLLAWHKSKTRRRLPEDLRITMWDFCGSKTRQNPDAVSQVSWSQSLTGFRVNSAVGDRNHLRRRRQRRGDHNQESYSE